MNVWIFREWHKFRKIYLRNFPEILSGDRRSCRSKSKRQLVPSSLMLKNDPIKDLTLHLLSLIEFKSYTRNKFQMRNRLKWQTVKRTLNWQWTKNYCSSALGRCFRPNCTPKDEETRTAIEFINFFISLFKLQAPHFKWQNTIKVNVVNLEVSKLRKTYTGNVCFA